MNKRFDESFEVHLRRRGVWTVERAGLTAPQAREFGESEFRSTGVDGLRIVRARSSRISGTVTEDLMVERVRTLPSPDTVVGPLDEAPPCQTIDDLLRPGARLALHRLFQGWLRTHEAGVCETLVSDKLLRRLFDNSALISSALHRVASLQTVEGDDPTPVRDRLFALADALQAHARVVEKWVVENVRGDPERLLSTVEHPGDDADPWRSCAAIAAYVSGRPTRLAKAEALIALIQDLDDSHALNRLDMFLADYVMDDDIALELAGPLGFLSDRLMWIAGAALGVAPNQSRRNKAELPRHGFADALPELAAAGRVPRSSFALLQAMDAILRRVEPLNDGSQAREQRAVLELVRRLGSGAGFGGGPRLAARLARRFASAGDGKDGFLEAADTIVLGLSDIHVQARFLLALLSGSHAPKTQAGLMAIANRVFTLYGGLKRLARRARSARALIAELDALCMLIDHAYIDRKARDSWTGAILTCLDDAVGARVEAGELNLHELLELAESRLAASAVVRETLVRRLSRAAGIVT